MNTSSTSPFNLPETAPELARRFCVILAGLAGLVARRFIRMPHLARLTLLLWGRLNRAVPRFARAMGKAATPRPKPASTRRRERPPGLCLPRGRGWLVRELGWEAAGYTSLMEAWLAEPGTRDMLAASPGLGRIVRPICRMLGVAEGVAPAIAVMAAAPDIAAGGEPPPLWVPAAVGLATGGNGPVQGLKFLPG